MNPVAVDRGFKRTDAVEGAAPNALGGDPGEEPLHLLSQLALVEVKCTLYRRTVRDELKRRVEDWRAPLTQHVPQARQLLRKVLADRLTVTPEPGDDRYSAITGDGTLTKILAGIVFPKGMASPEGFEPSFQP